MTSQSPLDDCPFCTLDDPDVTVYGGEDPGLEVRAGIAAGIREQLASER